MRHRYAVIGSGRQGIAAGYDLAKFGNAEEVLMIDQNFVNAERAAAQINGLLGVQIASAHCHNLKNFDTLSFLLGGVSLFVSAVPYHYNHILTHFAMRLGINMVDLGGHTWTTKQQLASYPMSKVSDSCPTIVPDCGMGPGMNISLALYSMSLLDESKIVQIWDGGLPQDPQPPLNYFCSFSVEGLLNEYSGNAFFIRNGKVVEVPALSDLEGVTFGEVGVLEAFVTSGGLSTMPWTFEGKLQRLENKTVRYPGHCNYFNALKDLGFLDRNNSVSIQHKGTPTLYEVLREILKDRLPSAGKDVCVMRVKCTGKKDGRLAEAVVELVDRFDPVTGFTAMQRLTGWHASMVGQMAAAGELPSGAVPVEMVSGQRIVEEARRRGFTIGTRIYL